MIQADVVRPPARDRSGLVRSPQRVQDHGHVNGFLDEGLAHASGGWQPRSGTARERSSEDKMIN